MTAHLSIKNLSKSFGGLVATNNVSLDFPAGSLTAIIGPNGAGKTTFFNLISGKLRPDAGSISLDGRELTSVSQSGIVRAGLARAFQIANIFPEFTVEEALVAAVMTYRGQMSNFWSRFPLASAKQRAAEIMDLVGLAGSTDRVSKHLSHGDQKLLDIALALALEPKVLLLDEPTAGMGRDERWLMINKVQGLWTKSHMTMIFIEHDMDIVFKISQSVRVLSRGAVLAEGTPDEVRRHPAVIEAYLGVDFEAAK
jgi:branched-chain amino acid transport system ATP-binding protein